MKRILILSEDKEFKKKLVHHITQEKKDELDYVTVSTRNSAINELVQKDYHAILISCSLEYNELKMILKYLSTNDYFLAHIFFISENFEIFHEILEQIKFPHLYLINLPISTEDLTKKILSTIYPKIATNVDKNFKINLEFLKVFIDSTKKVMNDFCMINDVAYDRPYLLTEANNPTFEIAGFIPLDSDIFQGTFLIGFKEAEYLKIIKNVLMVEAPKIDQDSMDFAAELVNMIYGQAKFILNDAGYDFKKIIPRYEVQPQSLLGKHHVVVVPFDTDVGRIFIQVQVINIPGFVF